MTFRKTQPRPPQPLRVETLEPRLMLATSPFNIDDYPSLPSNVTVGSGSLTSVIPSGEEGPSVPPNFTTDHTGPVAAAEWWSSVGSASTGESFAVYSHPMATHERVDGLAVGYPRIPSVSADDYRYAFSEDLRIKLSGLTTTTGGEVADYSDWTMTTRWENGSDRLEATIGHGVPFIYATRAGSLDAQIDFNGAMSVWHNTAGVAGVTINGNHYGLFAPTGSTWVPSGNALQSSLNGQDYFSIALLPDNSPATLNFFRTRAFAFVIDTQVSWNYDASSATATASYTATTQLQESGGVNLDQPLMALYRHQWLNSTDPLTAYTYQSSRGEMKLLDGHSFSTTMTHHGTLPILPELGTDPTQLYDYIDQLYQQPTLLSTTDTYFTGVNMYKLAQLVPLAEQAGHLLARERFLYEVRTELEDWFDSTDGGSALFYYDQDWNALIGYPDSFGSATALNDHHFHYGYFIQSAAIVAMYDPEWAQEDNWGGMVELLIRDVANWERDDNTFQFLRNFDVYAGHAWASGDARFARGNNQESSSEAMNFANGLILWGSVTGDTAIRDVGIFMATTQKAAIDQYWFDVDDVVFPSGYQHPSAGIVWSDGAVYATFFSGEPELIQGINYLPLTGGSLYLGHNPADVQTAYDHIVSENGGAVNDWTDLMASYLAFADPDTALADFNAAPSNSVQPLAKSYHWISSLQALGNVAPGVTADIPSYAVFEKNGVKTYVAYNPSDAAITATYSDGTSVPVPGRTLVATGGNSFSWAPNPNLQPPTPENQFFVLDQENAAPLENLNRQAGTNALIDELPDANGGHHFDIPVNPVVYIAEALHGEYDSSKQTQFELYLDAGNNVANMTQARVSYDFEGDGQYDRFEVFGGFPTDAANGWETYAETSGIVSTNGTFQSMSDGRVRLEVWSVFGPGGVLLRTSASFGEGLQSSVSIPFDLEDTPSGDFNDDGLYNCADIDALTVAIAAGTHNQSFDLTGDGLTDLADRDAWLAEAGAVNLPSGNPFLPGDANLSGIVDFLDFNIWASNRFTSNPSWCSGDFNASGIIDFLDFNIWATFRFQSALRLAPPPTPAKQPAELTRAEPAALLVDTTDRIVLPPRSESWQQDELASRRRHFEESRWKLEQTIDEILANQGAWRYAGESFDRIH